MLNLFRKIKYKRIAKRASLSLKLHFGSKQFYIPSELNGLLTRRVVRSSNLKYAYAMFASEQDWAEFTCRHEEGKIPGDLRFLMGIVMFGDANSVDYKASWNRFHDYNNLIMKSLTPLFATKSNRKDNIGNSSSGANAGYGAFGGLE